ncbi:MAG: isocitrate/isopropylmalate family dehydrogenase, partial [Chloroflexota bacterium]
SERIGKTAVSLMQQLKRQKLTIVHKANVLPLTDGLFRDTVRSVAGDVAVDELLVDVAALKLLEDPTRFDVIVTTNLFGDILSDAAAHWGGGLGYAASLNVGDGCAIAEPVHGSAPDIAGKGIANPIAAILSAVLLVRFVWGLEDEARQIETAVYHLLRQAPDLLIPGQTSTTAIRDAFLSILGDSGS